MFNCSIEYRLMPKAQDKANHQKLYYSTTWSEWNYFCQKLEEWCDSIGMTYRTIGLKRHSWSAARRLPNCDELRSSRASGNNSFTKLNWLNLHANSSGRSNKEPPLLACQICYWIPKFGHQFHTRPSRLSDILYLQRYTNWPRISESRCPTAFSEDWNR